MGNIVKMNGAMSLVRDAAEEVKIRGTRLRQFMAVPGICLRFFIRQRPMPYAFAEPFLGTSPEPFLEFGNCTMTPPVFVRISPTP